MRLAACLLLMAMLTLPGCKPPRGAKLLGKWQTSTGGTMEFKNNGTVTMSGPNGSVDIDFRLVGGQVIELQRSDGSGRPIQQRIESLSDQELVLVDEEGPHTLRKVP